MKRIHLLVLLSVLALPFAAASASGSGGSIVVSEVFAAGGNSGAPYAKAKDDPEPVFGMTPDGIPPARGSCSVSRMSTSYRGPFGVGRARMLSETAVTR
jgi:hypothetical protein